MLKFQAGFLVIINLHTHIHGEQARQIVVSDDNLAEYLYYLFDSHEILQVAGKSGKIKMTYYIDCQV